MQQVSPNNGGLFDHYLSVLQSVEGEEALLGSILINPLVINDPVVHALESQDFYSLRNAWVFEAMLALASRGEAIDNVTLSDELRQKPEQFSEIGGPAYLTFLINSTPTHIHASTYAVVVKSASRRRQALTLAQDIANIAIKGDSSDFALALRRMEQILSEHKPADSLKDFFFHISDLKNLPQLSWLIPGEIPERGLSLIFGPSGIGKSFVALDYAMRLSETESVVYIAAEGETGYLMRTAAWCKHHHKNEDKLKLHFFLNIVSLLDSDERKRFVDVIRHVKPRLIVVDTLAHCLIPGDENNTRDMGLFVRAAKEMRNELDCAVLLIHHTGKEGKQERGNSALRAACDVMIRLTGDDDIIAIECSKTKDSEPFPTRYVRLLPVETPYGSSPVIIASNKVIISKDDPLTKNQRKVLDALALEVNLTGATTSDLVDTTEIQRGPVLRILSKMLGMGYVEKRSDDKPYIITKQGLDKLGLVTRLTRSDSVGDSPRLSAPGARDSHDSLESSKKFVQTRFESHESGESSESEAPLRPCRVCGSNQWARSKITRGHYCVPCAETKAREELASIDHLHPKDQIIASSNGDGDDENELWLPEPR